jgi:hypothetical protein
MHWRVTLEAIDPTGDAYKKEFQFEKCLDQLSEGHVGCSVEHGKMIMAEIQKIVTEREVALWVKCSRICRSCAGLQPIKDYQVRSILTVYGAVQVKYPRLMLCQKCNPARCTTFSPLTSICPDRATPELLELSARLGATMPYRQASEILGTFLPCHAPKRFTTLRSRACVLENVSMMLSVGAIGTRPLIPTRKVSSNCLLITISIAKSCSVSTRRISRKPDGKAAGLSKRLWVIADAVAEEGRLGPCFHSKAQDPVNLRQLRSLRFWIRTIAEEARSQ